MTIITTTIGADGKAFIPQQLQERLGLGAGGRLSFVIDQPIAGCFLVGRADQFKADNDAGFGAMLSSDMATEWLSGEDADQWDNYQPSQDKIFTLNDTLDDTHS